MMRVSLALACILLVPGCSEEQAQTSVSQPVTDALELESTREARASSCMSDAECDPSENCECVEADSGNCESPGVCLPRDASSQIAQASEASDEANEIANCGKMSDLSFIPAGHHPVTARWELSSNGQTVEDTVCIAKTQGNQIQVLRWLEFPLPQGYRILYSQTTVDPMFRGCSQWSEWQGQRTCLNSWPVHIMQKI